MTTTSHQDKALATDTSTERTHPVTDTHQSTSSTLTHPELPGAVFLPRPDTDGTTAYWGAHLFVGGGVVCETIYDAPSGHPRYIIEAPEVGDGMDITQLHEFVAAINAYYAAVTRDLTTRTTRQLKGA